MQNKEDIYLGIIIPVFNNIEYTKTCLSRLDACFEFAQLGEKQLKIVLIDDGSTDGTSVWVAENYPDIKILKGNGSLWWSGGINKGVRHAIENEGCNYILWWNNDVEPAENYFDVLFSRLQQLESSIVLGSKIYIKHSGKVWSMGGVFNPKTGMRYMKGMEQEDSEEYNKEVDADWFPGMGTIMPSKIYTEIGYLDEINFPQYHGDSDYTYRAKLGGYRLIACPDLQMYNDISNTGIKHQGSFKFLYQALFGIKSNYNIKKDFYFFKKYSQSILAYKYLIVRYFKYVGGFLKWKILGIIGVKKS